MFLPKNQSIPRRLHQGGFTLVELLVVVAIIGILMGLILPALTYARFRAKVTTCTNNYRQWGVAVNLYATEDGRGRLPTAPIPVAKMTGYSSIEPWFVPYAVVTNMSRHGVTVPMWFCPLRLQRFNFHQENFRVLRGRELSSIDDMVDEFANFQHSAFVFPDVFWWVPRRLGESSLEYPDPKLMKTRLPDPWPRTIDDPHGLSQPFISDETWGQRDGNSWKPTQGHAWASVTRNSNSSFIDGHVETRPAAKLEWQVTSSLPDTVYMY